jgi:hypothetical protein
MPGILGLTYRVEDIAGELGGQLAQEIARYKPLRDIIAQSSAALLGGQAPIEVDGWDVVQETSDDQQHAILFAFKGDASEGTLIVQPKGLLPDLLYCVRSLDNGEMGCAPGADLMIDGVELVHTGEGSLAHLILFDVKVDDPEPPPAATPERLNTP